jgi:hypothetical protein
MWNVRKLIVMWLGASLAGVACAEGTNDVEGGEGGDASSSEGSSLVSAGSGSGTGATASTAGGMSSSSGGMSSSGAGGGAGGTGSSSSSGAGGGAAACVPSGDQSVMGTTGPCNANQNCPTTAFTAAVAGAPGPVVDVDLSLEAVAASTDQNILWLQSPQGTLVMLFNHHGTFLTDDFVGTIFDDEALQSVAMAPGPFHGCFKPDEPLAAFKGQDANGTWTLLVETCLYQTSVTSWTLHLDF